MKRVLNIAGWVLSVVGLIVVLGFTESELASKKYSDLRVNIHTDQGNFFVSTSEVEQAVKNMGYATGAQSVRSINITSLEEFFDRYPSVKKSQVYSTINGELMVEIEQRNPIVRVYTGNESFYIDDEGALMPLSGNYTAHVPVANGNIRVPFNLSYQQNYADTSGKKLNSEKLKLHELYCLVSTIREDELWNAQFNQVYVNENNDYELIPRVGDHRIILGDAQDLKEKLNKLKVFYYDGLNKTGWNEYDVINLKYHNQVVCTKN
jgi:cell division protein FtsQ